MEMKYYQLCLEIADREVDIHSTTEITAEERTKFSAEKYHQNSFK